MAKKIIICGAGEVGKHASEILTEEGHDVTVIDLSAEKLKVLDDSIDVNSIKGNSCHARVLQDAGIHHTDILIAATDKDEVNILTAALGKKMGCAKVIARVHEKASFGTQNFDFKREFGIDHIICPEKLTSNEITSNIADPGVMEIQHFADNQLEMHRYDVNKNSKVINKRLSQVHFPKDIRVAIIQRGNEHIAPDAETELQANDLVTLIGRPEAFIEVQSMFKSPHCGKNIVIMGATSLGAWLVTDLLKRNYSIRVFEPDKDKAVDFSERFSKITVINSDPTDPTEFESERLERCSAFIAVGENDEHNILGALQAKKFGVQNTVAVIHSKTFIALLGPLGIDHAYSPRMVAAKSILRFVDDSAVRTLSVLAPDVAEIYEVGPASGGKGVNAELTDVSLPKGSFIAAVQRNENVFVPGAKNMVNVGDVLIIIGPPKIKKELKKMFLA